MRILVDYRPALRDRSGTGEYVHQLVRALAAAGRASAVTLLSSSWKDRPLPESLAELGGVRLVDRRIPVRTLNFLWHRLGWPAAESLAGDRYDVVHSPHPLLLPTRHAAQVITIHDLDFLTHPERTHGEVRRDYSALVRTHAVRADKIIVPSQYTAGQVGRLLDVEPDRIAICPHGAPDWAPRPQRPTSVGDNGYILFVGTLEPRKNIGALLRAYGSLVGRRANAPKLVLAGRAAPGRSRWLDLVQQPPLVGKVDLRGYVRPAERRRLYEQALMLVLPSFDEGFGLPALEAMATGVPVVASTRGALPEVVGDAGLLVEPEDVVGLEAAIERLLSDETYARTLAARGLARARRFSWQASAAAHWRAYEEAVRSRQCR